MKTPELLWHVSDDGSIPCFVPRSPAGSDSREVPPAVWAVDDTHLTSYLLPRECPRITLRRGTATSAADAARFFGVHETDTVLYIESDWLQRALATPLWIYGLPGTSFELVDANAGYFTSLEAVAPVSVRRIESPLSEALARQVEVRVVPRLRAVAPIVTASSLAFSVIRLRNARP